MKDLTAVLMGDPGTSLRRQPTQQELDHMRARTAHEQKRVHQRYSELRNWPLGEVRTFATFKEANSKQAGLYQKGMRGILRSNKDGTYIVRRVQ